jgi:DNA polymerase V
MQANDHLFALVDCNNFYASCEAAFRPDLAGRPILVLSNNDGNVVSLNQAAKDAGFEKFKAWFEYRELAKLKNAAVFSSNYTLYGSMSARVHSIISEYAPSVEDYSIDESFLQIDGFHGDRISWARELRERVKKWTGIGVSVGIGYTKTQAKIANRFAKKLPEGVFDLASQPNPDECLSNVDVQDIWGIGERKADKCGARGISNARQLRDASDAWIKANLGGIVGLRTAWELRGVSCIPIEEVRPDKQEIMNSRSFGRPVEREEELLQAISSYAARACEKLRRQNGRARTVMVRIDTNSFRSQDPQYHESATFTFEEYTSHTPDILAAAERLGRHLFRNGYRYKKAGVMLSDIVDEARRPPSLFLDREEEARKDRMMATIDTINRKLGAGTLRFASAGFRHPWEMRRENLSPRYTTRWEEVLRVKAC